MINWQAQVAEKHLSSNGGGAGLHVGYAVADHGNAAGKQIRRSKVNGQTRVRYAAQH